MTIIGTFSKTDEGVFRGAIRTLTLNLKAIDIRPVDKPSAKAPDHRVFSGPLEIGAAWTITRPGKPECLSVTVDDPALPSPVHALLWHADSGYEMRWSRHGKS